MPALKQLFIALPRVSNPEITHRDEKRRSDQKLALACLSSRRAVKAILDRFQTGPGPGIEHDARLGCVLVEKVHEICKGDSSAVSVQRDVRVRDAHAFEVVDHPRALCRSNAHADTDEMPLDALLPEFLGEEVRGDFWPGCDHCVTPRKGSEGRRQERKDGAEAWGAAHRGHCSLLGRARLCRCGHLCRRLPGSILPRRPGDGKPVSLWHVE